MSVYATIWSNVAGLTYAQAKTMAAARGGYLINNDSNGGWYTDRLTSWARNYHTRDDEDYYNPVWVGADRTDSGWLWGDGTPIAKNNFYSEDSNADEDLSNDSAHVISYGGNLHDFDPSSIVSTGYVMDYMTSTAIGTDTADWVVRIPGKVNMRLLGGDDKIWDLGASGFIDLGSGNDDVLLRGYAGPSVRDLIVVDGEGSDYIEIEYGTIKASLDGDDDPFLAAVYGQVSYEGATQDIVKVGHDGFGHLLFSTQIGTDTVLTEHLVLGSGNDTVSGFTTITGGRGNDTLTALKKAEGGNGDDTLIADSPRHTVRLLGESGNDTLVVRTAAEMTGGAGTDIFRFEGVARSTINDLSSSDKIDLSALLGDLSYTEARDSGYLKIDYNKGYTFGFVDLDGGGDNFVELFNIKGVIADVGSYIL